MTRDMPVISADLSTGEIAGRLKGDFWKNILLFQSVDSTNELAFSLSSKGDLESGTVIIADMQEKGRGRMGRKWISPPGVNIYMSVILEPGIPARDAALLTVLASLASALALQGKTGLQVSIKWPNDLIVSGKKIGGILTEVRSGADKINVAIIGIGVNVNMESTDLPGDIRGIATSVKAETGAYHSRSEIIGGILDEFERWYKTLTSEGRSLVLSEWRRLSSTIGKNVQVALGGEVISGSAESIDDEGTLMLRLPSGEIKRVRSGDVTILR